MKIVRFGKSFRALLLEGKAKLGTVQLYQRAKKSGKAAWRKWQKKTLWADVKIEKGHAKLIVHLVTLNLNLRLHLKRLLNPRENH